MKWRSASSREKPKVICVRSLVPKEKDSASVAISTAVAWPRLGGRADQRDHELGPGVDLLLAQVGGRFHDRAHLHAGDLGEQDRQPNTTQPEHRVGLVQVLTSSPDLLGAVP